ncbi:hypothetical protein LB553_24095 [Mesorhizobium sp. CA8]|uniref:hypothetical protein n=1 Tax=unclassified Mesorhizobium TaxID=325217 RepID=UPI001CCAC089|nr:MULTISPECIES: hypothetical protein [unclassified Mesorhizobium]MBZ9763943.1 hypothetical protein [Mesorhizobium sp. CA8]MBZ9822164.1 hypothetical protein [Mesorhizobium sp. CA4]
MESLGVTYFALRLELCLPTHVEREQTHPADPNDQSIESWSDTYRPAELAKMFGLTIEQAKIVIGSNGPSKHGCEVGAQAFRNALKMRSGRQTSRRRNGG